MKLNTLRDIGSLVRQVRKDRELTQVQLAELAGVSRDWIIRLEQAKGRLELALVLRTLKALNFQLVAQEREKIIEKGSVVDLSKILEKSKRT